MSNQNTKVRPKNGAGAAKKDLGDQAPNLAAKIKEKFPIGSKYEGKVTFKVDPIAGDITNKLGDIEKAIKQASRKSSSADNDDGQIHTSKKNLFGLVALLLVTAIGFGWVFTYMSVNGIGSGDVPDHPHHISADNHSFRQISTPRIDAGAYPLHIYAGNEMLNASY